MKYTENYKVSSHDVDENDNIRPSLLLRYMQETANHQMRDRKPTYYDFFHEGKAFVVTRIGVEIYEQIHQYDEITARTWRCPGKSATLVRCYDILKNGRVAAQAYSEWAVANRNTGKLCRISELDLSNYDTDDAIDLKVPVRFRFPSEMQLEKAAVRHIYYSDVDMNRHMNNTNYPDILWSLIPGIMDKKVDYFTIRFMKEAPLGGDIDIYMTEKDGAYCFKTKVEEGTNIEAVIGVSDIKKKLWPIENKPEF